MHMIEPKQYFYLDKNNTLSVENETIFGGLGRLWRRLFCSRTYDLTKILETLEASNQQQPKKTLEDFFTYIPSKVAAESAIGKKLQVVKAVFLKASPEQVTHVEEQAQPQRPIEPVVKAVFLKASPEQVQTHVKEQAQPQRPIEPEKLLRTFDPFDIKTLPQDFDLQQWIEKIRSVGRRRDTTILDPMDIDRIRHEAKFIGVTEVAYKKHLCQRNPAYESKKDPSYSKTWKEQVEDEEKIARLLQENWDASSPSEITTLLKLMQDHPPLSTPSFLAQIIHVYRSNPEHMKALDGVIKHLFQGVSSRRLTPLCNEAFTLVKTKYPEISIEEFRSIITKKASIPQENPAVKNITETKYAPLSFAERKKQILEKIAADLKQEPETLLETIPFTIRQNLGYTKDHLFKQYIHGRLNDLQTAIDKWEGPFPAYYHGTKDANWEKVAQDGVLVTSIPDKEGYAGAYVATVPEPYYGGVIFAFSEEIFQHAQMTMTRTGWFGANREIPINEKAQEAKEQAWKKICDCFSIPDTWSHFEKKAFFMSVRNWLENWTSAVLEEGKWKLCLRIEGSQRGEAKLFDTNLESLIQKLQGALSSRFQGYTFNSRPIQITLSDTPHKIHTLCAIFGGKRESQELLEGSEITLPTLKKKLQQLGFSKDIPVLDFKIGVLLAYYNAQIGFSDPLRQREGVQGKAINAKVALF